jgi:signal transduction histidine kinase
VVLAIASAVVGVACVIYVIVTRTVLTPLESLTAATQRVRAGDLDAAVPVVTADDLGTLTASFNQMLSGLREREALQTRNERLASELRDSLARLAAASDEARRQVERDLHDGAQQRLVLLKLKLAMLERDPSNEELLAELRGDLDAALAELRDLAHGIYPAVLESDGLHAALADGAARASISTRVECDGVGRYPREVEAAVYFCCLEALQNAAKHAGEGATAAVRLRGRAGELRFEVTDDGRGCDVGAALRSGGMQNMSDRVGALGGTLRIESEPGKGTTVTGTIPVGAGST